MRFPHTRAWRLASAAVVAAAVIAAPAIASAASVGDPGPTGPVGPQSVTATLSASSAKLSAAAPGSITCYATPSLPSVISGYLTGVGDVYCTSAVSELAMTTDLVFNGSIVAQGVNANFGRASLVREVRHLCRYPFHYHPSYVFEDVNITFPPGYTPQYAVLTASSPTVTELC